MSKSIKTTKVVLKSTGEEYRGVKVTAKNIIDLANWAYGHNPATEAMAIHHVSGKGVSTNHRVRVRTRKGFRVARVGDVLAKKVTKSRKEVPEFIVIKAADFATLVKI